MKRYSWKELDPVPAIVLTALLVTALVGVPWYVWQVGLDGVQVGLFLGFFVATGLSITLGYHRLFSHRSFKARWPVRLSTLLFGAAAFENSALSWAVDHRRHHKHVDHDEDPYNAHRGLFYSHIGWLYLKDPQTGQGDNTGDLRRDRLVMWQDRNYVALAVGMGLVLPAVLGGLWGGWLGALGGFLIPGVARIVVVQQFTFFINSLCHYLGSQPYSTECTARDSGFLALFTFGEGYHNFHHSFQHDYRNGVLRWQFDPTKWTIWLLSKIGLASDLRRVPMERILRRRAMQEQRMLALRLEGRQTLLPEAVRQRLEAAQEHLEQAYAKWEVLEADYRRAFERKLEASRDRLGELQREFNEATSRFRCAVREWQETCRLVQQRLALAA